MKIERSTSIAKLAAELPGAMSALESLGIDYACAGHRTLEDAARAEGIDPEVVVAGLRPLRNAGEKESWAGRPLTDLVRYLVTEHHRFLRDDLAATAVLLADVCTTAADSSPDLVSLRAAFTRLSEIILPHLHREEHDVFRAIESFESAWIANEPLPVIERDLASHITQLTMQHGAIAARLHTLRELRLRLSQANELPPRCSAILKRIEKLEAHLHEYIFLENTELFPRVLLSQERKQQLTKPAV